MCFRMIKLIPIKAECHAGFKADEYPKSYYLNNEKLEIKEITDRWYQYESNPEFPVSNYFKVITTLDQEYIIKHEIQVDKWYLCRFT